GEGDHGQGDQHGDRRRGGGGRHRGRQAAVDEWLQGGPDKGRGQAGAAGGRGQPLLGGLRPWPTPNHPACRSSSPRPSPAATCGTRACTSTPTGSPARPTRGTTT